MNSSYGLWLNGNESPGIGYANRTNWFEIETPANSSFPLLSLGQIIGAVVGATAALLIGTAAIEVMLRLTRNASQTRQLSDGEACGRGSFDSISDEKAKAEYRYQLH